MKLPFDSIEFFNVFGAYNAAVWPLQIVLYLLSLFALLLFFRRYKYARQAAFYLLALLWLVNGIGYHLLHFSVINKAAFVPDHHFYVWDTAGCRTPPVVPVFDPAALGVHRHLGRIWTGGTGRFRFGRGCYRFC